MNTKMAKMLAFFGVIFACINAAFNTFRTEWVKYKTEFPDEPEPEYNENLTDEQIAAMQNSAYYQQPQPVEGLVDVAAQQAVFARQAMAQEAQPRVYTEAQVLEILRQRQDMQNFNAQPINPTQPNAE